MEEAKVGREKYKEEKHTCGVQSAIYDGASLSHRS
jgi:hypothetical protein